MLSNKLSIKALTIAILFAIGIAAIILSIITSMSFRSAALESEAKVLTRIIEVASHEIITILYQRSKKVAESTENDRNFRKALKDITSPENKETVVARLDDQFKPRYVTSGLLSLVKLRIYNKNFKLLIESSSGATDLPQNLPDLLHRKAKDRKGGERLKAIDAIWLNKNTAYHSVLTPIGGLHLTGYLEVVTDPIHNLKKIESMLNAPLKISNLKNEEQFVSQLWTPSNRNTMVVDYQLTTENKRPALHIQIMEDITEFSNKFDQTEIMSLTLFAIILAFGILFALHIFNRSLFKPMQQLIHNMKLCANGDLTVDIKKEGLTELQSLSESLRSLVSSLNGQVREIQGNIVDVSNAAGELSIITSETNQAIQQQQQETDQVATAINELSATVSEVAKHAEEADSSAQNADKATTNGKKVVQDTINEIDNLAKEIDHSTQVIEKLKSESENIGSVMSVIRGIAEQTNLLALNAAIEAARAGEQGRGFAVVADEVRVLASRTQESTQEIEKMIDKIQYGASEAMRAMEESKEHTKSTVEQAAVAGQALETITNSVAAISDMNTQIASAAEEQNAVAEEISKSIENISSIAQITAKGATQTAASSDSLADLSGKLQSLVAKFRI